jgi:hypothetical protein
MVGNATVVVGEGIGRVKLDGPRKAGKRASPVLAQTRNIRVNTSSTHLVVVCTSLAHSNRLTIKLIVNGCRQRREKAWKARQGETNGIEIVSLLHQNRYS